MYTGAVCAESEMILILELDDDWRANMTLNQITLRYIRAGSVGRGKGGTANFRLEESLQVVWPH